MPQSVDRLHQVARLAALTVARPLEVYDRIQGRRERALDSLERPNLADVTAGGPRAAAHQLLGQVDTGCCDEVSETRERVVARLTSVNRRDGGTALAEMLWIVTRHLEPERVVETGVARGISSAFILDALERNGHGGLWSIDLPPMASDWRGESQCAVPPGLSSRWTYIRGAARRHLPRLLDRLDAVDLFVHDGLHTRRNMLFEMRCVWPHMSPGAVLIADDADDNDAVLTFAREIGVNPVWVREPLKDDVVAGARHP